MRYVPLGGFEAKLVGKLPAKDRYFPILPSVADQLLHTLRNSGDYSYLILQDGNVIEAVKVENYCGRLLLTRGIEQTKPLSFRCGTCVIFKVLPQGIKDWVCQNDTCNELLDIAV